ncbi:hypothetical protein J0871_16955 [Salegentibacter sp. BDJ18]|uniref:hypothetical protein n=1 Tax=Salegentibacter sp. BDJ18 TaxID=2816376 RepID=UPI001AAE5359|nr:hypothetical protein [Salegentibacter sp. BDJ18]MBO2546108.1 hypothetical protein [Salegentibacter sp. BDJ18]
MATQSDFDKFLELYRSVGVEPEVEELKDYKFIRLEPGSDESKVIGYSFFYTKIVFDKEGKFLNQVIAE